MLIMLLIMAPFLLLGLWAQRRVTSTFETWSHEPSATGLTGEQVARRILDRNGLADVQVLQVPGALSDHYDPRARTVNLSEPVFGERSVSAVSVAAHEVGHAIQHATSYAPMTVRSAVFPAAAFGSAAFMPLFFAGIVLLAIGAQIGGIVMIAAIGLYAASVLFQLVTLPVEFDASRRAKGQLHDLALQPAGSPDERGSASVLNAAAMTYVAAALAAVAQLLYFALMFLGGDE